MKWIDIPPIWLAACLGLTWWIARTRPLGLAFDANWIGLPAGLLIGGGVLLMVMGLREMRKWHTTVMPRQTPARLVQSGIYRRTRNPIYLGDVLFLAGVILWLDAPLALPLVPVLLWVLERRFVIPEEDRLRRTFRQEFYRYTQKTRRWV